MNPAILKMLKHDGIHVVTRPHSPLFFFVLVEAGVCHQLKPLGEEAGKAMFRRDGVLSNEGLGPGPFITEGPILTTKYTLQ